jgi:HD-GYP domain-containing protein (c-di-GMP phosphodiesterase class II)
MNYKKKALFSVFATLFFLMTLGVSAQHGTGTGGGTGGGMGRDFANKKPEDRAKQITSMMKEQLKLNADQEKKAYAINLKYAQKNEEVRKIKDEATQKKTVQTNNKDRDKELQGVFTADQFKAYQKLLEERRNRQKNRD